MPNLIEFKDVDVGERFFDPNTTEDYCKTCGNAAEWLTGGNYQSGQLLTFCENEIVVPHTRKHSAKT